MKQKTVLKKKKGGVQVCPTCGRKNVEGQNRWYDCCLLNYEFSEGDNLVEWNTQKHVWEKSKGASQ